MAIERIKYITAVIIYGTIGVFLRYITVPEELVAMARGIIGSVFILLYLRIQKQSVSPDAIRQNRVTLLISGVLLGLNWVFLFAAYVTTTVAIASLCNYMAPLIVVLVAPFVLKEKLNKRKLPFILTAFLGIVLVSGISGSNGANPRGVLYGLLAALCFVGIVLCNRRMTDISPYDRSVIQLALSAVTICPFVIAKVAGSKLTFDTRTVLIILMLGVVHTGFAYCLYFSGMASLPVQTVAVLGYIEPAVSVLCSFFFLREHMGIAGWTGAILILASAVISELLPEPA